VAAFMMAPSGLVCLPVNAETARSAPKSRKSRHLGIARVVIAVVGLAPEGGQKADEGRRAVVLPLHSHNKRHPLLSPASSGRPKELILRRGWKKGMKGKKKAHNPLSVLMMKKENPRGT